MQYLGAWPLEPVPSDPAVNILSVDLECWSAIICQELTGRLMPPSQGVAETTEHLLDLLKRSGSTATFFVLGSIAEAFPDLIRRIASEGHETASHGLTHTDLRRLDQREFRREVEKSVELLERITDTRVLGFRAPKFSIVRETFWALEVLRDCGIRYDGSVFPIAGARYGVPGFPRGPVRIRMGNGVIVEAPPSTIRLAGRAMPFAGGRYFRFFPYALIRKGIRRIHDDGLPFLLYLHPYELSAERLSWRSCPGPFPRKPSMLMDVKWNMLRSRQRSNLTRLISEFRFVSIKEALGHALGA